MQKYSMTCSCGDTLTVDAESREQAVAQLKAMMDEQGIKAHMDAKHPGKPYMSVAECHRQIDEQVVAV
jgi:uncharacterized short protein YbdD (DUF466 family)